jgi:hypothetical protein
MNSNIASTTANNNDIDNYFVFAGKVYRRYPTTTSSQQLQQIIKPTKNDESTNNNNNKILGATTVIIILSSLAFITIKTIANHHHHPNNTKNSSSYTATTKPPNNNNPQTIITKLRNEDEQQLIPNNNLTTMNNTRPRGMSGDSLVIRRWSIAQQQHKNMNKQKSPQLNPTIPTTTTTTTSLKNLVSAMNNDLTKDPATILRKTSLSDAAKDFISSPENSEYRERLRRESREWIAAREWFSDFSSSTSNNGEHESERVIEAITKLLFHTPATTQKLSIQDVLIWLASTSSKSSSSSTTTNSNKSCERCHTVNVIGSEGQTLLPMSEFRRMSLLDRLRSLPLSQQQQQPTETSLMSEKIFLQALSCDITEPDAYLNVRPRWYSNFGIMTFLLEESMEFSIVIKSIATARFYSDPTSLYAFLDSLRLDGWKRPAVGVAVHSRGLYGRSMSQAQGIDILAHIIDGGQAIEVYFHHLFPTRLREYVVNAIRGTPSIPTSSGISSPPTSSLTSNGEGPPSLARLLFSNAEFPLVFAIRCTSPEILAGTNNNEREIAEKLQKISSSKTQREERIEVVKCTGLAMAQNLSSFFDFEQAEIIVFIFTYSNMAFVFSRNNDERRSCMCALRKVLLAGESSSSS